MNFGLVIKMTIVNRSNFQTLYRNITRSVIMTRKTTKKWKFDKWGEEKSPISPTFQKFLMF